MATTARGTVQIDLELCKGCELCIPACPPGVLAMSTERNGRGYHYPILYDGCTGCGRCVETCPDFVIAAFKEDDPGPSSGPPHAECAPQSARPK
jgi:2-oxoglutarate ferredoxin oxidoreductase subunit delta